MSRRNKSVFQTMLMASDWYRVPRAPYKSKFWSVELVPIPLELSAGGQYHNGKLYKTKQVVIRGHTRTIAQQALNLIHDVLNVIAGSTVFASAFSDDEPRLYSPESSLTDKIEIDKYPIGFSWNPQICLACMIAARASLKMASVYALSRLSLSIHLFSTSTTLLSPYRGQNVPKSDFPHDRVAMALAIVAAYSCIEELGVEIRASTANPSRLTGGMWNPTVKSDLEQRLRNEGIDLAECCYWHIRGPRTKIELKRAPVVLRPAPWSGHRVRDKAIDIVDAIDYSSFLRNKVAAHKTNKKLLRVLSAYDVANVQLLARRLLLESLGFWGHFKRRR